MKEPRFRFEVNPNNIGSIFDTERKESYMRKMSIATMYETGSNKPFYTIKITNALNLHEELSKKEPHKRTKAELVEIIKKYL